jgi:hypothetical protein
MSMTSHSGLAIHPVPRTRASCCAASSGAAHPHRRDRRAGAAGPGRGPHAVRAHRKRARAGSACRRKHGAVRAHHHRAAPPAPARRWRCPARCKATCRRRWRRAPAATCGAGPRTSAAASPRASCWPRSRRRSSTSSCRRRSPRATRPPPAWNWRKSTVERWEALRKRDAVSQQELEEKPQRLRPGARQRGRRRCQRAAAAPAGRFQARGGAVRRRHHARNVDIGDLIDSNKPLFLLSQTDPLRVYVNVPQAYAQLVQARPAGQGDAGRAARPRLQGHGGAHRRLHRRASRTMQVEIGCPTSDGALLPGAFVQVELRRPRAAR